MPMLHGARYARYEENHRDRFIEGSGQDDESDDSRQNDEVGVEDDENASMVKAPLATQAARGFSRAADGGQQGHVLPGRAVQMLDVREAGEPETGCECTHGEQYSARQRLMPQAEDVQTGKHNTYNCRTLGLAGDGFHLAK